MVFDPLTGRSTAAGKEAAVDDRRSKFESLPEERREAIVSAAVLDRYPGKDTVAALKRALCHRNWYVRYNAASSLVRLGASQAELQDVFEGNDAFARDILQYMLEEKEMGRV